MWGRFALIVALLGGLSLLVAIEVAWLLSWWLT